MRRSGTPCALQAGNMADSLLVRLTLPVHVRESFAPGSPYNADLQVSSQCDSRNSHSCHELYRFRLGCCHWGHRPLPLKGEGDQTQSRRPLALPYTYNQHNQSLSQRTLGEGGRAEQGREGAVPWRPPPPLTPPPEGRGGPVPERDLSSMLASAPIPTSGRGWGERGCANNLTTSGIGPCASPAQRAGETHPCEPHARFTSCGCSAPSV
jgi:hypothetical protein